MNVLGNTVKAGFYPTQEPQARYMKDLIKFTGDAVAMDTTCGTGEILAYLAQPGKEEGFNIQTYGVEIDLTRGQAAQETLDHAIIAPIESCVISNDSVQLMYLNPPYMNLKGEGLDEGKTVRAEYIELERAMKYIAPGGLLMYVIPFYQLAHPGIARMISTQLYKVSVMRFTDENYEEHKQVLIIGYKKKTIRKEFNEQMYETLLKFGSNEELALKHLPTIQDNAENPEKVWEVPNVQNVKLRYFETRLVRKSDIAAALSQNGELDKFIARSRPLSVDITDKQPPLPLSSGQIAILLAAGGINGIMGTKEVNGEIVVEEDNLHILRGREVVTNVVTTEKTETGVIEKTRTKRDVNIKAILPSGQIIDLK